MNLFIEISIFQEFDDYFFRFPKQQILDPSKLKEFADDDFKFEEIDKNFSKCLENTVGKEEIACYSVFRRLVLQTQLDRLFALQIGYKIKAPYLC